MVIKKNLSKNCSKKFTVTYPKFPVSYPENPGINEKSSDLKESDGGDHALHYEVTKGKFGNNSRQSITYRNKKHDGDRSQLRVYT